jgi:hypothetical protein
MQSLWPVWFFLCSQSNSEYQNCFTNSCLLFNARVSHERSIYFQKYVTATLIMTKMTRHKYYLWGHSVTTIKLYVILKIFSSSHCTHAEFTWQAIPKVSESEQRNSTVQPNSRRSHMSYFPCPTRYYEPHPPRPGNRTVHQLRPQDVEFVASLGDSITAGMLQWFTWLIIFSRAI